MISYIQGFFARIGFITITNVIGTLLGILIVYLLKDRLISLWIYIKSITWLIRIPSAGISNFFPNRKSYEQNRSQTFIEYLSSSKHSLDYYGHWLAFSIDQHNTLETLCELIRSGKKVQLTLLDPAISEEMLSTYARYFNEKDDFIRNQLVSNWGKVISAKSLLGSDEQQRFILRKHCEFVSYSAFWFDKDQSEQHILIDAKIFGISRRDSYGIVLKPASKGSLFDRYSKSIDALAKNSQVF